MHIVSYSNNVVYIVFRQMTLSDFKVFVNKR
jgi:hypothetical protein